MVGKTKTPADPYEKPPLDAILNLNDFEEACSRSLTKKSWAFISGASNDNLTRDANKNWYQKIWFRPKVMSNVSSVNTRGKILGCAVDIPVFISPAGVAKMAGPEGELALAKGAAATGVIQCISTTASFPISEILASTPPSQSFFFQLYVNKDRSKTEALLKDVTASGKIKAILVTADLAVVSKREADERVKQDDNFGSPKTDKKGAGLARQTGSFIDPALSWNDLAWLRAHTTLPILVKGIQRPEDARIAMQMGCQGIVVSNHGGRALDNAPASILTLLEIHKNCPEVFGAMEILIDGGVRRGSDILKAICLGATGVGLGRPFMYAVNYGTEGVEHAVNSEFPLSFDWSSFELDCFDRKLTFLATDTIDSPERRARNRNAPLRNQGLDARSGSRLSQYRRAGHPDFPGATSLCPKDLENKSQAIEMRYPYKAGDGKAKPSLT